MSGRLRNFPLAPAKAESSLWRRRNLGSAVRPLLHTFIVSLVLALVPFLSSAQEETEAPADAQAADVCDLVLFAPTQPLRIRLHIFVNGTAYRDAWLHTVEGSFDRFDADETGRLGTKHAARLFALFGQSAPSVVGAAVPPGSKMEMEKSDELTRAAAVESLARLVPSFAVQHRLSGSGAGPALFPLLDSDGDGTLSPNELKSAQASLRCRDFNDDLMLTEQELIQGPAKTSGAVKESQANDGLVVVVDRTAPDSAVETILYRYDRNRDGRLSYRPPTSEVHSLGNALEEIDVNRDQSLDRAEIAAWLAASPDVELPIHFGVFSTNSRRPSRSASGDSRDYQLRRKLDGGYRLSLSGIELDFRRNNRDPAQAGDPPKFNSLDANMNGSLDKRELESVGLTGDWLLIDMNRDDKVTIEELHAYQQWQGSMAGARIVLEVSDRGQDLFTLLDTNGDRFLSPREMLAAGKAIAEADANRDGSLSADEITYHVTLELSRGGSRPMSGGWPRSTASSRRRAKPATAGDAPEWFTKMDRNHDGELSRAEFLGNRTDFERLDADTDGLISPAELTDKP